MNTEEKIAVMQHYADGGKVRVESNHGHVCIRHMNDCAGGHELVWDWKSNTYSIVKEPKHIWVAEVVGPMSRVSRKVFLDDDPKRHDEHLKRMREDGYKILSVDEYVSK